MLILGLTGSIAMGKSATAAMFRQAGVPVFDADACVHALYAGAAAAPVEAAFPGTARGGQVDRAALSARVVGDPAALARLEAIVHPLVRDERERFLDAARSERRRCTVFDIPLLFETGARGEVDAVVVVTAPAEVQRARALARPDMDAAKLDAILARQMPDVEKRARAHFRIDTDRGFDYARRQVEGVLRALAGPAGGRGGGRRTASKGRR